MNSGPSIAHGGRGLHLGRIRFAKTILADVTEPLDLSGRDTDLSRASRRADCLATMGENVADDPALEILGAFAGLARPAQIRVRRITKSQFAMTVEIAKQPSRMQARRP